MTSLQHSVWTHDSLASTLHWTGLAVPPSPDGMSAAAILATLSDSRPPTSHGGAAGGLDDDSDDQETGGIALEGDEGGMQASTPALSLPPPQAIQVPHVSSSIAAMAQEYFTPQPSHAIIDQHAAMLEALSMEQVPTPPIPTVTSSAASVLATPPATSAHELAPSAYEEHLSIQDVTAFIDITSYCHYYCPMKRKVIRPMWEDDDALDVVTREDLLGDRRDFQGIDWTARLPRAEVRQRRAGFERSRLQSKAMNVRSRDQQQLPDTENYFSFKRMNRRHRAHYPHFQLRNMMAATSRNDVFYATKDMVVRTDAAGSPAEPVVDLRKRRVGGVRCTITTLAAADDVLVAGGFEGEYVVADLSSADKAYSLGVIKDWAPDTRSYISNHVHLFRSRSSYTPQAVLCSNDASLRVLDCQSDTFLHSFTYPSAVNCSATSPDGRLRVVVGDFQETLITNAETGKPFESLKAHTDDAFACAWADDGVHLATAAQDSTIVVWDARNWRRPVACLASELSVPRVLRFSPVGSGPRVLVAAEADDYVNVINAQTYASKQTFDFFGPTAGIGITPDGQSLFVANAERRFGGIIELERTGWNEVVADIEFAADGEAYMDWIGDSDVEEDFRVACGYGERVRRGMDLGSVFV